MGSYECLGFDCFFPPYIFFGTHQLVLREKQIKTDVIQREEKDRKEKDLRKFMELLYYVYINWILANLTYVPKSL